MKERYKKLDFYVPESQRWTLEEPHKSRIKKGLLWTATNPPREADLELLLEKIKGEK